MKARTTITDIDRSDQGPWSIFLIFFRLGLTSFGGPIAHLGYFREEFVTRRQWVSERGYADLVALCQFLPGPASSQVGMALGLSRAGYLGGLYAALDRCPDPVRAGHFPPWRCHPAGDAARPEGGIGRGRSPGGLGHGA